MPFAKPLSAAWRSIGPRYSRGEKSPASRSGEASIRWRVAVVTLGAILAAGYNVPRVVSDSQYYENLAEGRPGLVPAPFSQRILFPDLVRSLHLIGLSFRVAFVIVAVIALVVLFATTAYLLRDLPAWALPLLLATPFVILSFREAYLPDLTFAAMLAGFLVLLKRLPRGWTPLALIPMFATRESTLLVAAVLGVLAWRKRKWVMVATTAVATAIGLVIEQVAARAGQPTHFHIGGATYLVAKLPYNFMKNIAGFPLWTNHVSGSSGTCAPYFTWTLPHLLQRGSIHAVGVCNFTPDSPLTTLATWLTLFGIAPTVLLLLVPRDRRPRPLWLQLALWYGMFAFIAGPLLGSSVRRLIGYGWPALIVGAAVLLSAQVTHHRLLWLLALSFVLTWVPAFVSLFAVGTLGAGIVILTAVPAQVIAARWLRTQGFLPPSTGPPLQASLSEVSQSAAG